MRGCERSSFCVSPQANHARHCDAGIFAGPFCGSRITLSGCRFLKLALGKSHESKGKILIASFLVGASSALLGGVQVQVQTSCPQNQQCAYVPVARTPTTQGAIQSPGLGGKVVNVMEYGAKCNGTINPDDTIPIQNAIEAACNSADGYGGVVVIPVGTCMVTPNQIQARTFIPYSKCTIQGFGKDSILKIVDNAGNYGALFFNCDQFFNCSTVSSFTMRDFRIDQNYAGQLSNNGCTPNCHCPNGAPNCGTPNCPNACTDVSITNGCKNVSGNCAQIVLQLWGTVSNITVSDMIFDATGGWVVNIQGGGVTGGLRTNLSNNTVNFHKVRSTDLGSTGASACTGSNDSLRCASSYVAATPWVGLCPDGTTATADACNFAYDNSAFYFEGEDVSIADNVMQGFAAAPPPWTVNTPYVNGQFVQNGINIYRLYVPAWKANTAYTSGQIASTGSIGGFNQNVCMRAGSTATSGATQPVCNGVPIGNCVVSDGAITWTYQSTCCTSAISGGGPTGTGNGIVDGTPPNNCLWNYTGYNADRGSNGTAALEIHGGRYSIIGNIIRNYLLLNAVPSSLNGQEVIPSNWVVSNNTAICGGGINLNSLSNCCGPSPIPIARGVRNVTISGNTVSLCNAEHQGWDDFNGTYTWIAAAGNADTTQDAMYDTVNIVNNDITFQEPDDRNSMFYNSNAAMELGGHIGSCGPGGICPSRSSWNNLVIIGNTIRDMPNTGIFLDICKTVPVAAMSLSRAISGVVTATVPANLPSTCTDGRSACCPATTNTGHLFVPGQTVYLTPGEANFPAGFKVITNIGTGTPSLMFSYNEAPGTSATSGVLQNFQAVGSHIRISDNTIIDSGHSNIGTLAGAGAGDKRAAIQLVDGPFSDVEISRNKITDTSSSSTLNGEQGLDFQTAPGSAGIRLAKNTFTTFGTGKLNAPYGPLNGVVDTGELLDVTAVTLGAGAVTYTPDPTRYSRYLLTLTATAPTIASPFFGFTGQKMEFTLKNTSGGNFSSFTWGSATATIAASPNGATEGASAMCPFGGSCFVTITTTAAHGFSVGQQMVVSGVGISGYNGTWTILTVPTTTTFTYTNTVLGLVPSGGGTAGPPQYKTTLTATPPLPATTKSRTVLFTFDGTNWIETYVSPADVLN